MGVKKNHRKELLKMIKENKDIYLGVMKKTYQNSPDVKKNF